MFAPSPPLDIIPRVKRREIEEQTNNGVREKSLSAAIADERIYFQTRLRKSLRICRRKQAAVAFLAGQSIKPIRWFCKAPNFLACRHRRRLRRHGKFLDKQ